jgi:hypothetical protein
MKQYLFHTFRMGDVEDPEIYAAVPINDWQQTEKGKWVMEHCPDPQFRISPDAYAWGHLVSIYGPLEDKDGILFVLKWSDDVQAK